MNKLISTICEALDDKKGENITIIDLDGLDGTICSHFIVASAESSVAVEALSENVEKETFEKLKDKVIRVQGRENALWIAMDFGDVMVHIFQNEMRDFYRLEELWGDAKISKYQSK